MQKRDGKKSKEIIKKLGYKLLNEYVVENYQRRVVIQDHHGYKYDVFLNNITRDRGISFVDKGNPFTLLNISLWLKKENKPFKLCKDNFYKGSFEKLFFQCLRESCGEVFVTAWRHVYSGKGCTFCAGKKVGRHNNLAYLKPDLVKEWDYEKNEKIPEDYTCGSREKVSWICSKCEHSWKSEIAYRSNGRGCPKCYDLQKESKIANELKEYFKENYGSISEYKILKNPKTGYWLPYDIYIPYGNNPDLNGFYIEVHWDQHYKPSYFHNVSAKRKGITPEEEFEYQKYKDEIKKSFAKKNGIYIEIDLRKINTIKGAIEYVENQLLNIFERDEKK